MLSLEKTYGSASSSAINVKIFSVGGADTIYIEYPNGKSLLFDCGKCLKNPSFYTKARGEIEKLTPTGIVISHWHSDHCNLLEAINRDALQDIYINGEVTLPSCYDDIIRKIEKERSIKRTYLFSSHPSTALQLKGYMNTYFFLGNGKIPSSPNLGVMAYTSTDNTNNTSIILVIENNNKRLILPSDVSYYCWPNDPLLDLSTVDYLMIPHHGCSVYITDPEPNNSIASDNLYVSRYGLTIYDNPGRTQTKPWTYIQKVMGLSSPLDIKATDTKKNDSNPYHEIHI